MKLCWLIPDDRGGGTASVVLSCCHEATRAGHETTLLMALQPSGWITDHQGFELASLGLEDNYTGEIPIALLDWLTAHPQDYLFLNGCEQSDTAIPHLPQELKCIYVVHDTARRYWSTAVAEEHNLDSIVAVSEVVARQFRHLLNQSGKLSIIHNGAVFPELLTGHHRRPNDLIFMGGDKPVKGAYDILRLWETLIKAGFEGKLYWFGGVSPRFQERILHLPASNRIHIYGRVQRDVIFTQAAAAKVLLMLSRVESFGMATIEAMSMGCVPVAWDIDTGTREIVTADETGLFAPLGDFRRLAHQVMAACENYQKFHQPVIDAARTRFNARGMWQGYQALIAHLAKQQPIERSKAEQTPQRYQPPVRRFQLLPASVRTVIREIVGRNPKLGYWLRDFRGF